MPLCYNGQKTGTRRQRTEGRKRKTEQIIQSSVIGFPTSVFGYWLSVLGFRTSVLRGEIYMFLTKVQLQNFRNYENLELTFGKRYNFLFGENAQGKSSFLEALFCFSLGKSYSAMQEHEVMRWGADYAIVKAEIKKESYLVPLEINYAQQNGNNYISKNIRLNNKHCPRVAELIKNTFFIHFSPHDFNIIKGGSSFRRKFLDFLTTQLNPAHLMNLLIYNKCLAQRNILLKKYPQAKDLDVWNEQLAKTGSVIIAKRLSVLEKFIPVFIETAKEFFMENEFIGLEYMSTIRRGTARRAPTIDEIISSFHEKLNQIKQEEIIRKMTLAGPHRDDFAITINEKPARHFASFGQQHSLALALKLAQARLIKKELNQNPILLLDDCFVGLDKTRQNKIWTMLKNSDFSQVFITSPIATDLDLNSEDVEIYEVNEGTIKEQDQVKIKSN